jgi:hypothetical protein
MRLFFILACFLSCFFCSQNGLAQVHVRGYTRSNGTYVAPYVRRSPSNSGVSSSPAWSSDYRPAAPISNYQAPPQDQNREPSTPMDSSSHFVPASSHVAKPVDPNWIPETIENGEYIAGHYKQERASPATVIESPRKSASEAAIGPTVRSPSRNNVSAIAKAPLRAKRSLGSTGSLRSKWITQQPNRANIYSDRYSVPYPNTEVRSPENDHDYGSSSGVQRDQNGHIKRSQAAKGEFMRMTGYPHGRPGYVVDHIVALKHGGADAPCNMQWQTVEEAKAKDKWE